jgi:hypothetical protein
MTEPVIIHVAIRGFLGPALVFQSILAMAGDDIPEEMQQAHMRAMMKGEIDMLEIEFLDYSGPERFIRFGTNPELMVDPIEIDAFWHERNETA